MKRLSIVAFCFFVLGCGRYPATVFSDEDDRAIRSVLAEQEKAWNDYSLDAFMNGYWKSDSLEFIGSKITTGWQATLDRYKRNYPTKEAMGQLTFEIYSVKGLTPQAALVTGRYTLTRTDDTPTGLFTLLFKKMNNQWVIVYDHTS